MARSRVLAAWYVGMITVTVTGSEERAGVIMKDRSVVMCVSMLRFDPDDSGVAERCSNA
jgi:hypothetical protein